MNKFNILHYSFGLPPYASGGLPLFVADLVEEQEKNGSEVTVLLPKNTISKKCFIKEEGNIAYLNNSLPVSSIFGMKNPKDFIKEYDKEIFVNYFKSKKFDIIHVHSLMGLPLEFLEAANDENIPIVYTTHDYYGLCLKCNFIDYNGQVCDCASSKKCAQCNKINGLSSTKQYLIGSTFYKQIKNINFIKKMKNLLKTKNIEKGSSEIAIEISVEDSDSYGSLLNYYKKMFKCIDYFHFNSSVSKKVYEGFLGNINGEIITISLKDIINQVEKRKSPKGEVITFGYIGRKEPYKGIKFLLNNMKELHNNGYNFSLKLYGDDFSNYDQLFNGKVINMGTYNRNELINVFNEMDLLIVPSIWKETFGFITLESLSCGCPVIVSENVGSKDLLSKSNIFETESDNSLKKILIDKIRNYNKNIDNSFSFDYEKHSLKMCNFKLFGVYNKLLKKEEDYEY